MSYRKFKDAIWNPTVIGISSGVVLYILLSQFSGIWSGIRGFIGYFTPVIMGAGIAYIVNPLVKLFERLLARVTLPEARRLLANALAVLLVIVFFIFAGLILVPQLITSIETFIRNSDAYLASINGMLESWGLSHKQFNVSEIISSSEEALNYLANLVETNMGNILTTFANAGKEIFQWVLAFIFAIYILLEKPKLKTGFNRLLGAVFGAEKGREVRLFLKKCDKICSQYVVFNMIDSLIIGGVNAVFMMLVGMPYMGLISFVVAIANLIPTFGPMIGMVIGGFVLVMVNPWHALAFVIFSLILQVVDGYILKPRLFGSSLGVSGLWILVGIIVGGNMFGILGILLAIPVVAILDLIYNAYIIPGLESRFSEKG